MDKTARDHLREDGHTQDRTDGDAHAIHRMVLPSVQAVHDEFGAAEPIERDVLQDSVAANRE